MAGHTDNEIFIAAPFDVVWELANDVESWPELFDGEYAAVEVLERHPGRVRFRLTTTPVDGKVYSWTSERCMDRAAGTVAARRLESGVFRYLHIFQSFTPTDGGVVLRWVQDFELRPDAPIDVQRMQARIDSGCRQNLARHKLLSECRVAGSGVGGN